MRNKYLQKLVKKMVEVSFRDGRLAESQATKCIKILKGLPKYQSIEALGEYLKGLKRLERQHTMFIQTVIPISQIQLRKIKEMVEKKVKVTRVVTSINPEILGGFILKVGDEVWDQSMLDKITQVKEAIVHGGSD